MRHCSFVRLSYSALVACFASLAWAQDFVNGGFEYPVIATDQWAPRPAGWGWYGAYNVGIANGNGSWGTGAYQGQQYGYIESDGIDYPGKQGWIEQTITGFVIGDTYDVTFWMAQRNGDVGGNTSNPIEVILNGSSFLMGPTYDPDTDWSYYVTDSFVATSTTNTIRFQTTQTYVDSANLLDDIHIGRVNYTSTPGPSAALAFSPALGALLRRRTKALRLRPPGLKNAVPRS